MRMENLLFVALGGAYILLSVAGCLAGVALGQALARRAGRA